MERLGIFNGWLSESILLKRHLELYPITLETPRKEAIHSVLTAYGSGKNPFKDWQDGTRSALPPFNQLVKEMLCSPDLPDKLIYGQKKISDWMPAYSSYSAYAYWQQRLDNFQSHNETVNNGRLLKSNVNTLSSCLYLGWQEESHRLTKEIWIYYKRGWLASVNGPFSYPLYHWLLRICFDYYGYEFNEWGKSVKGALTNPYDKNQIVDPTSPGECLGEPVLNELYLHWRDADLTPMHDHLVWLCDYYTHLTRPAQFTEFGNDLLHTRFPVTILAWFRLRQQLGLSNPDIDHPLMKATYAQLVPAQPMYTDELLQAAIARLRLEEIPNLGDMPIDMPATQPVQESKRLIARFFGKK